MSSQINNNNPYKSLIEETDVEETAVVIGENPFLSELVVYPNSVGTVPEGFSGKGEERCFSIDRKSVV